MVEHLNVSFMPFTFMYACFMYAIKEIPSHKEGGDPPLKMCLCWPWAGNPWARSKLMSHFNQRADQLLSVVQQLLPVDAARQAEEAARAL
jgi:hypothetical protein